jgi:hypothetical protein
MNYQNLIRWIAQQKHVDYNIAREELGDFFISFRGRYTKSQVERIMKLAMKDRSCTSYERFKKFVKDMLKIKFN